MFIFLRFENVSSTIINNKNTHTKISNFLLHKSTISSYQWPSLNPVIDIGLISLKQVFKRIKQSNLRRPWMSKTEKS